jgi:rhodanese-related sulfurtransferase
VAETPEITIETFAARRGRGVTVDVREPHEYNEGHVPGARLIPVAELAYRLAELDRAKPIHVICASGHRSKAMTDLLVARGFDAASVAGGTQGWIANGNPVEVGP